MQSIPELFCPISVCTYIKALLPENGPAYPDWKWDFPKKIKHKLHNKITENYFA